MRLAVIHQIWEQPKIIRQHRWTKAWVQWVASWPRWLATVALRLRVTKALEFDLVWPKNLSGDTRPEVVRERVCIVRQQRAYLLVAIPKSYIIWCAVRLSCFTTQCETHALAALGSLAVKLFCRIEIEVGFMDDAWLKEPCSFWSRALCVRLCLRGALGYWGKRPRTNIEDIGFVLTTYFKSSVKLDRLVQQLQIGTPFAWENYLLGIIS